jgi:hypothetical protein
MADTDPTAAGALPGASDADVEEQQLPAGGEAPGTEALSGPDDPEAPVADVLEQQAPAGAADAYAPPSRAIDAPEADALEQTQPLGGEDDDHR